MDRYVFDASAILAIYYNEAGSNRVRDRLSEGESLISAVNVSEVFGKLLDDDIAESDITTTFEGLDLNVVAFDQDHAMAAAHLLSSTKHLGLSIGDRACLSLAQKTDATAVTADRIWKKVADPTIECIR